MKIPAIKNGKIVTVNEDGLISTYLGITNVSRREWAITEIKKEASKYTKFKNHYDCKYKTQMENRRWGKITEDINIFEQCNVKRETAVVSIDSADYNYECVCWFTAIH